MTHQPPLISRHSPPPGRGSPRGAERDRSRPPRDRRRRAPRRRRQLPAAESRDVGRRPSGQRPRPARSARSPRACSTAVSAPGRARRSRSSSASSACLGGTEAVHYTRTVGPSGDDFTGLLSIPAGAAARRPRRRRRCGGHVAATTGSGGATGGGCCSSPARSSSLSSCCFPLSIAYVVTHVARAHVPPADLGAAVRGGRVHDERRPAAEGLVHQVAERRRGDLVPRPGTLAGAGEAARAPRLRRPALRPSRRGRERGRPEPVRLAGRARHPRGRRVPAEPARRRPRADRRHRPLGRRRDDDRGGGRVDGAEGDRLRGRQRPFRPRRAREPGRRLGGAGRQQRRHRSDRSLHRTTCLRPTSRASCRRSPAPSSSSTESTASRSSSPPTTLSTRPRAGRRRSGRSPAPSTWAGPRRSPRSTSDA